MYHFKFVYEKGILCNSWKLEQTTKYGNLKVYLISKEAVVVFFLEKIIEAGMIRGSSQTALVVL